MKQISFIPFFIFLFLFSNTQTTTAQDFSQVGLSINSVRGNNNCHATTKNYSFSYAVNLPADRVRRINQNTIERETYTIVYTNTFSSGNNGGIIGVGVVPILGNFPSNGVSMIDRNHRPSLKKASTGFVLATNTLNFDLNPSGNFIVHYSSGWNENKIELTLDVLVQYKKTRTMTRSNGTTSTSTITTIDETVSKDVDFIVAPPLSAPQSIIVNGTAASEIKIDPFKGCKVYTLNAGNVAGATRYRWVVSPSSILVSGTASLNSSSIQVKPNWGNGRSSVRLEAIQDCDGSRSRTYTIYTRVANPSINVSKAFACYNNGETHLSIPSLFNGANVTWTYDASKIQLVSGQGTKSIRIKAKGNFGQMTRIQAHSTSPCGTYSVTSEEIWLGTPTMPTTNPSGYPTVTLNHQSFIFFTTTNHSTNQGITGYNWSVSPNQLTLQPTGYNCRIWGTNTGWYNYYVTRSNVCGNSPAGGGAINVVSGSGGPRNADAPALNTASEVTSFNLYPNPVKGVVRFHFLNGGGNQLSLENIEAELIDMNGRLIQKIVNEEFNTAELSPGVYLVKINTGKEVLSQKLVVD